jgi:hypothetical protein
MKFYVNPKSDDKKAIADFNVKYGFPINTWAETAATDTKSENDGTFALSTGMKIYFPAGASGKPLAKYYGFYVPRMIPFFSSQGNNQIDVVVNSKKAIKCWSWGSYNGDGWFFKKEKFETLIVPGAADTSYTWGPFFDKGADASAISDYYQLMQMKEMNMVICEVGTTDGTADTGDAIMIPATQVTPWSSNANNPLPQSASTAPLSSSQESMITGKGADDKVWGKIPLIAGADQYMGEMNLICRDTTQITARMPQFETKQKLIGSNAAVTFPLSVTSGTDANDRHNDNAAGKNRFFDVLTTTDTATTWVIGAAKLNAILQFGQAAKSDWNSNLGTVSICAPQTNFVMDPSLVMLSGTSADGKILCTGKYDYTVGANNQWITTGYAARKQRWCRWCAATHASNRVSMMIKDFVPATTKDRRLTGFTVLSSDDNGWVYMSTDAETTATRQNWVEQKDSACGKGQTMKQSTNGQLATFTMKSPVPIAVNQVLVWEVVTGSD